MKIKVPQKIIEVCDSCGRDSFLQECLVCGKKYCLTCHAIICGCWVSPNIGKCCQHRDDVNQVVKKYADKITPIIKKRDVELKSLSKNVSSYAVKGLKS